MEHFVIIGTLIIAHFFAVISPGPDFFLAVRNSLNYSRKTGIWTALGFGLGIAVHITYCIGGLALIISKSIIAFNILKYLGAGYLIYIGLKSFFSKTDDIKIEEAHKKPDISGAKALSMGFLTNVLNPKATLFFLSIFTFVISPETPKFVVYISGAIMIINTALWFSLVAIFFSQKKIQKAFNKFQKTFNKILGGILVTLGIKLAF